MLNKASTQSSNVKATLAAHASSATQSIKHFIAYCYHSQASAAGISLAGKTKGRPYKLGNMPAFSKVLIYLLHMNNMQMRHLTLG